MIRYHGWQRLRLGVRQHGHSNPMLFVLKNKAKMRIIVNVGGLFLIPCLSRLECWQTPGCLKSPCKCPDSCWWEANRWSEWIHCPFRPLSSWPLVPTSKDRRLLDCWCRFEDPWRKTPPTLRTWTVFFSKLDFFFYWNIFFFQIKNCIPWGNCWIVRWCRRVFCSLRCSWPTPWVPTLCHPCTTWKNDVMSSKYFSFCRIFFFEAGFFFREIVTQYFKK